MREHTIIVPDHLLNEYLDERRLTVDKATTYVNKKESERVKKWFLDATILCLIILLSVFVYIHW